MITGLFCHYLPIYKDINGIYCSTTLTNDFFKRYFCVVDKLIVADRVYSIDKTYEEVHQEPITLDNVEIVEFPNLSSLHGMFKEYSKSKRKINNLIESCDLIFIRGGVVANLGAQCAQKQHKPYLVECAGCAWDEYWNYSLAGKLLAPYMEHRSKKNIKNASYVVYVTEKWLQKRYPTNGVWTYASNVMLENIDDVSLDNRLAKISDDSHKGEFVIGTTGGIGNKAKGQQFVMRAMKSLKKKYNLRYELVGGGDDAYLKKEAKKDDVNVGFKGQLTHEEVLKWLDSIDLYIQPSMQEGLPRSLIEAMSRACPAVGSTTGGIPELLNPSVIFKRGDVSSLTKVLDETLQSNLKRLSIQNFHKAKEYQLPLINKRRETLYRQYRDFVKERIKQ